MFLYLKIKKYVFLESKIKDTCALDLLMCSMII